MNSDKVFINKNGWVEVIWGERIDWGNYLATANEMMKLILKIEDEGKSPLMLIDFSNLEEITPEAADLASKVTKDLGCRKIAGFGIKPEFTVILDTIKERSAKGHIIKEFLTREKAEKWLAE